MSDISIVPIFSEFIASCSLNLDNKILENDSLSLLGDAEQYHFKDDMSGTNFNSLFKEVHSSFNKISTEIYKISEDYTINLDTAWINKNNCLNFVLPHEHPGCNLSAVYYVKSDPTKSYIRFRSPNQIITEKYPQSDTDDIIKEFNGFNSATWTIPTVPGMLLIFPSWLTHYVVNTSVDTRISIAFNGILSSKQ